MLSWLKNIFNRPNSAARELAARRELAAELHRQRVAEKINDMGSRYLCHPDNRIKLKESRRER